MKGTRVLRETRQAYDDGFRVIANKGGTRSTKTWSVLQLLWSLACNGRYLISVVSESLPHLRIGAMRDFQRILDAANMVEGKHYTLNKSTYTYTIGGSMVEFYSVTSEKAHGAQRDILFINEANHISYEVYRQLAVRTSRAIFIDFNPSAVFWFDEHLAYLPTSITIHSTYLDNPFLSAEQIRDIESGKDDANWWKVYGLGETGSSEGLVFSPQSWNIVPTLPADFASLAVGIDFGYTIDPTAIVEVRLVGGELWVDCPTYERALLNNHIADRLSAQGYSRYTRIVADSSEGKSIAEINAFGFNVQPVEKGADSVRNGLQVLQRYRLHVTERSIGLIRELRAYSWRQDRDGHWLGVPEDRNNHAIDALRYVAMTYYKAQPRGGFGRVVLGHY